MKTDRSAHELADFMLRSWQERRLADLPERTPPLSGAQTQQAWIDRAQEVLDFLDGCEFDEPKETGDAWTGGFAENH